MSLDEKNLYPIGGQGGSGGGSTPSEDPDTLQSHTFVSVIDLLGEGQIGGLVGADTIQKEKSIYLDGTPMRTNGGTENFKGVSWVERTGTQEQSYIDGYGGIETPTSINVQLKFNVPKVISITNSRVDEVRIILAIGGLMVTESDGDIRGSSVSFSIGMATNSGASSEVAARTIKGKASSRYQVAYTVKLPKVSNDGTPITRWDIQVTRTTSDSTEAGTQDDLYFDSYSEVITKKLTYPNSALVATRVNSEHFSSMPKREYLVDGLLIKVPSNYNHVTREYTGIWDGSFKLAPTSNPAWIMFDILTNNRYGLGEYIDAGLVDEARLYQIGRYCDQMVDDGFGNLEPRYTVNCTINSRAEAYDLITDICSAFNGMSYWAGGQVGFTIDAPSDPVMAFTSANIEGEFSYSGTSVKDRHSIAVVTYNDPKDDYKQAVEYVEDPDLIERYGVRKIEIQAFGCTSRAQAHRYGRWILYTEHQQSEVCSFTAGMDASTLMPGSIVQIQDEHRAGKRFGGRLLSCTATSAILDDDIDFTGFETGLKFAVMLSDGSFVERDIATKVTRTTVIGTTGNTRTATEVTWVTPLENLPVSQAVWVISAPNLELVQARVVGVKQGVDLDKFDISVIPHNPNKYAAIEKNVMLEVPPTSILSSRNQVPPSEVRIKQEVLVHQGLSKTRLVIDWERADKAIRYSVEWKREEDNWVRLPETANLSAEVEDVYTGTYIARVTAIGMSGARSYPQYSVSADLTGKSGNLALPVAFEAHGILFGMEMSWAYPANSKDSSHVVIEVSDTNNVADAKLLAAVPYPATTHTVTGLMGNLTQYYRIKLVDKSGNESEFTPFVSAKTLEDPEILIEMLSGHVDKIVLSPEVVDQIEQATADNAQNRADLLAETAARIAELQATQNDLVAEVDARTVGDATEAAARAAAIASEADARATAIASEAAARATDIATEAEARIAGDATEAAERATAIASAIATEAAERATAIAKEAMDRAAALTAESTARANAIMAEETARNAAINAKVAEINTNIATQIDAVQDGIDQEVIDRTDAVNTVRGELNTYKTSNDSAVATALQKVEAVTTAHDATVTELDALQSSFEDLTGDLSVATSDLSSFKQTVANADAALGTRIDNLTTTVNTNNTSVNGRITNVETSITTLESNVNTKTSQLQSSLDTTNTNVTAAANAASAANTLAGGKGKVLFQSAAPAAADRLSQNLWIDTTSGANTPKRWNGTAWVVVTDKIATDALAAANAAAATVATKADASAVDTLTTRVTTAESTITSTSTKVTNLENSVNHATTGLATKASTSALNTLDGKVTTIDGKVTANTSDITALQNRVTLTEDDLETKADGQALTDLTTRVIATEGSVSTQGQSITSLQGSLATTNTNVGTAQTTANAKGKVIYSTTAPATADRLTQNLWIDTTNNANTPKRWNGTAWVAVTDKVASDALAAANTANTTVATKADSSAVTALTNRVTTAEGTITTQGQNITTLQGNITSINDALATKASGTALSDLGTRVTATENNISTQSQSITSLEGSLSTTNTNVTAAQNAANAANTLAGGKGKVLYQSTAPATADRLSQNLWIDTTGNTNTPKRWNGTAWVAVTDKVATDALAAANAANTAVATKADASAVNTLTTRVSAAEGTITSQGTRVTNLENSVNHATTGLATKASTTALNTLDGKVTTIDGKTTANTNDITSLSGRVTTVEGAVATKADATALNNYYTKTQSDSALAGQVTAFDAKLRTLPSQGENLVPNGTFDPNLPSYGFTGIPSDSEGVPTGCTFPYVTRLASRDHFLDVNKTTNIPCKAGDVYEISVLVACATGTAHFNLYTYRRNSATASSNLVAAQIGRVTAAEGATWKRLTVRWTVPTHATHQFFVPFLQIDQSSPFGTVWYATDWSCVNVTAGAKAQNVADANATAINTTNAEVTRINGVVVAQGTSITNLQSELTTANNNIATKADGSAVTALTTRVSNAEGVNTSQGSAITSLENTVNHSTTGLASKASSAALTAVDNKVTAANGRIDTTNSNVTALTGRVSTVEGDVAKKADASALTALTTRVTNAEGVNTSQGTAITTLQNTVNHATTGLATKASTSALTATNSEVTRINGVVTGHANQLTQLSSDITTINGTLATKANASALNDIYTKTQSDAKATEIAAGQISQYDAELVIGGTNLLKNSEGVFTPNTSKIDNYVIYPASTVDMINGKEYTLSGETNGEWDSTHATQVESNKVTLWLVGNGLNIIISNSDVGTKGRTFVWDKPSGTYVLRLNSYKADNSIWFKNIKIESGNKRTDWSPSPSDVKSGIDANATAITNTNTEVARVGGRVTTESNRITTLTGRVDTVVGDLATKADASALNSLTTRVVTEEGKSTSQGNAITALQNTVNHATTGLSTKASSAALTAVDNKVTAANGRIDTTNSNVTTLAGRVSTVEGAVSTKAEAEALTALTTRVTNAEGVNTSQGSAITTLQNTVNHATTGLATKASTSALNTLDSKVTGIDGRVTANASSITNLQAGLATANNNIATKADGSALTALTTRVSSTEGNITSQSTRITNLENSVNSTTNGLATKASSTALDTLSNKVNHSTTGLDAIANKATALETKVNAIKVGGSNLFALKELRRYNAGTLYTTTGTYFTVAGTQITGSGMAATDRIGNAIPYTERQDLTIAFTVVSNITDANIYYRCLNASGAQTKAQTTAVATITGTRYTLTLPASSFPTGTATVNLGFGGTATNPVVKDVVVQLGNMATAWTESYRDSPDMTLYAGAQALTDLTTRVSTAEGKITSQATSIANLSTTVGNQTTSISTLTTSVNGINASHTVKINNNGYSAGFGLISTGVNGVTTSAFKVDADFFEVGKSGTGIKPFIIVTSANQIIEGVTYPSAGTYINSAKIANATIKLAHIDTASIGSLSAISANLGTIQVGSANIEDGAITTAKIGDLQVDTLKIKDNAVTVPVYSYTSGIAYIDSSAWITSQSIWAPCSNGVTLFFFNFSYDCRRQDTRYAVKCRILKDGVIVRPEFTIFYFEADANSINVKSRPAGTLSLNHADDTGVDGTFELQFYISAGNGWNVDNRYTSSLTVRK
ncbi:phage tail protein [Acinetobacter johnsonii]|uniref:TipJ family phage tail tip protein n=1 Tax=Acinetobacter johnsonii TaxID=40214 RepID=UPI00244B7FCF|nr:phage tail protein [Acinetobacter johnsonii]MDH2045650.1 phage tail protein [Acinetobacter johnsonii]